MDHDNSIHLLMLMKNQWVQTSSLISTGPQNPDILHVNHRFCTELTIISQVWKCLISPICRIYPLGSLGNPSIGTGECAYFFPGLYNNGWLPNFHFKIGKTLIFPMSLNRKNDQTPNKHCTAVVSYIKLDYFMGIGQYGIHQFQAIFTH